MFSIFFLFVALPVLLIIYARINAKILSREEFRAEAEKVAKEFQYKDPVITCNYCRSVFDTSKYDACPNCGASYADNMQWVRRHNANLKKADKMANNVVKKKLLSEDIKTARKLKTLKILIIIDAVAIAALIVTSIIGVILGQRPTYSKSEELNDSLRYNYQMTSYTVDGDNTVFDENNVKVTITGFAADPSEHEDYNVDKPLMESDDLAYYGIDFGKGTIEFTVENNSNYDVQFDIECPSINDIASHDHGMCYETVKSKSTLKCYLDSLYIKGGIIKDFCLDVKSIREATGTYSTSTGDDITFNDTGIKKFTTTVDYSYEEEQPKENFEEVYNDKGISIYEAMLTKYSEKYSDESDRRLVAFIYNDTDDDATVSCQDFIINNHKSDDSDSILYNEIIPAHTMYITTEFDDAYLTKYYDEKYTSLQASLTFSFSSHQENDFSTGYITFSKE